MGKCETGEKGFCSVAPEVGNNSPVNQQNNWRSLADKTSESLLGLSVDLLANGCGGNPKEKGTGLLT